MNLTLDAAVNALGGGHRFTPPCVTSMREEIDVSSEMQTLRLIRCHVLDPERFTGATGKCQINIRQEFLVFASGNAEKLYQVNRFTKWLRCKLLTYALSLFLRHSYY